MPERDAALTELQRRVLANDEKRDAEADLAVCEVARPCVADYGIIGCNQNGCPICSKTTDCSDCPKAADEANHPCPLRVLDRVAIDALPYWIRRAVEAEKLSRKLFEALSALVDEVDDGDEVMDDAECDEDGKPVPGASPIGRCVDPQGEITEQARAVLEDARALLSEATQP